MQKRFIELITTFLDEAGIECPIIPGENIVTVPLGDFSVSFCLLESRNAIVMQGTVGIVPSSRREDFYAELLRMNSLFTGTGNCSFGLEDDAVTMQGIILMQGVTQEAFTVQAVTFLQSLAAALEDLDGIVERSSSFAAASLEADLLMMQSMLRI